MDSYADVLNGLGARARALRLLRNLQQAELATRAGISAGTVKRFEQSGKASLENVLRIATALGADQGFERLFEPPKYRSIDEAMTRPRELTRQRVRKRSST